MRKKNLSLDGLFYFWWFSSYLFSKENEVLFDSDIFLYVLFCYLVRWVVGSK